MKCLNDFLYDFLMILSAATIYSSFFNHHSSIINHQSSIINHQYHCKHSSVSSFPFRASEGKFRPIFDLLAFHAPENRTKVQQIPHPTKSFPLKVVKSLPSSLILHTSYIIHLTSYFLLLPSQPLRLFLITLKPFGQNP